MKRTLNQTPARRRRGFTLLELLIAMSVFAIILVAPIYVTSMIYPIAFLLLIPLGIATAFTIRADRRHRRYRSSAARRPVSAPSPA